MIEFIVCTYGDVCNSIWARLPSICVRVIVLWVIFICAYTWATRASIDTRDQTHTHCGSESLSCRFSVWFRYFSGGKVNNSWYMTLVCIYLFTFLVLQWNEHLQVNTSARAAYITTQNTYTRAFIRNIIIEFMCEFLIVGDIVWETISRAGEFWVVWRSGVDINVCDVHTINKTQRNRNKQTTTITTSRQHKKARCHTQ